MKGMITVGIGHWWLVLCFPVRLSNKLILRMEIKKDKTSMSEWLLRIHKCRSTLEQKSRSTKDWLQGRLSCVWLLRRSRDCLSLVSLRRLLALEENPGLPFFGFLTPVSCFGRKLRACVSVLSLHRLLALEETPGLPFFMLPKNFSLSMVEPMSPKDAKNKVAQSGANSSATNSLKRLERALKEYIT